MKLTPTQKNILIRMDRGEVLYENRLYSTLRMSEEPRAVRPASFDALWNLRLIEQVGEEERRTRTYRISDKGREAIQ